MQRKLYSPPPNTSPSASSSSSSSSRGVSPSGRTDYYDDTEDYSPVVSDIEDQDENDERDSASRTEEFDLLQLVNEQSGSKCDLEEESIAPEDELEDEGDSFFVVRKNVLRFHIWFQQLRKKSTHSTHPKRRKQFN